MKIKRIIYTGKIKERGNPRIIESYYVTQREDFSTKDIVDFWGLDEPDVEQYELKKTEDEIEV